MRWNRSSIILDSLHKSQSSSRHGIGFSETKNPNIECLCSHCGLTGHKSHACDKKQIAHQKKISFLRKSQKKTDPEPGSTPKVLPRWARKILIHPFNHKQALQWMWVPKLTQSE